MLAPITHAVREIEHSEGTMETHATNKMQCKALCYGTRLVTRAAQRKARRGRLAILRPPTSWAYAAATKLSTQHAAVRCTCWCTCAGPWQPEAALRTLRCGSYSPGSHLPRTHTYPRMYDMLRTSALCPLAIVPRTRTSTKQMVRSGNRARCVQLSTAAPSSLHLLLAPSPSVTGDSPVYGLFRNCALHC